MKKNLKIESLSNTDAASSAGIPLVRKGFFFPIINIIVKYGIGFKESPATGLVTAVVTNRGEVQLMNYSPLFIIYESSNKNLYSRKRI